MPRILGYVFNPLSVYFCYRTTGDLHAIVYEVNNTFGGGTTMSSPIDPQDGDDWLQHALRQAVSTSRPSSKWI